MNLTRRNKAAITLMWDLDARPHEITLLKIKHIRLEPIPKIDRNIARWFPIIFDNV